MLGAIALMGWLASASADPVTLPDAARSGAARPAQERAAVIPQPTPEMFKVPPVPERPLDIDAGEHVQVTSFELVGAVDRPEFDIAVSDIQALVDAKRGAHPDGFSVGRLQEVADDVTKYYRAHGLILAQAFIPVQTVNSGIVRVQILEGMLGRVVAEGQKLYKERLLQRPFADLIGQPVTKETIESALLELSRYPGVSLFGVFQPGQEVGTADMVVKVQDEHRFDGSVRFDNHGIRETGRNRYRLEGSVNNLTGAADRLTATGQHTTAPSNSFFWGADYERPLPELWAGTLVRVHYDRNKFDVGGAFRDRDIASDTRNLNLSLSNAIIRSRQRNLTARVGFARKRAETAVRSRPQSRDDLANVTLGVDYDSVDAKYAGLNSGTLEASHGFNNLFGSMGKRAGSVRPSRQGGSRRFAEGAFNKLFFSFSRLQSFTPLTDKLKHHSLLFRLEGQWSPDLLVPLEQYSVGGPTSVRAYQPTERLFDRAVFGSVEWIINAPGIADRPAFGNRTWGEIVQVSFFFDVAYGDLNDPLPTEIPDQTLKGAGFAISVNDPKVFSSKLSIATPIGNPDPVSGRDPVYWLDLNVYF